MAKPREDLLTMTRATYERVRLWGAAQLEASQASEDAEWTEEDTRAWAECMELKTQNFPQSLLSKAVDK